MYKVIIADDEEIECIALEMMIKNSVPDCQVLPSVYNGVELLAALSKGEVDVAIVDINMPGMKGLEVIENIRLKNWKVKVIINTAYSDFEYMKKAMNLGVVDYILKPVKKEYLSNILNRTFKTIGQEQKERQNNRRTENAESEIQEIIKEHIMSSLLLGEVKQNYFEKWMEHTAAKEKGGFFLYIQAETPRKEHCSNTCYMEDVKKKMDLELERVADYLVKLYKNELYYYVITGIGEEQSKEWLIQVVGFVSQNVKKVWGNGVKIGISSFKTEAEELIQGLKESMLAVNNHRREGIFLFSEEKKQATSYLSKNIEAWKQWGYEKNWEKLGDSLIKEIKAAEKQEISYLQIKKETMLCLLEFYYQRELPFSWKGGNGRRAWEKIMEANSYEDLKKYSMELLGSMEVDKEESIQGLKNKYVQKALDYIEQFYNQDISLEETAEQVGITSFYLSRLFKQELNVTFLDILTEIRMEKAAHLLMKKDGNIKDISKKTGYINVSYFYKVFKRYFGITVGEMRDSVL